MSDQMKQKLLGFAGWSGSGKTTLLVHLIPALKKRGLRLSTIKHAHHAFDLDQPGKDSWKHRQAGATEVLISSQKRWAVLHELGEAPEPELRDLLPKMAPVDLILVEGFKRDNHPKIEIFRPTVSKPLLYRGDPNIIAVATENQNCPELTDCPLPLLNLDDSEALADFIITHLDRLVLTD